jgi:hypothetical protein
MIADCAAPHPNALTVASCDRPVNHAGDHSRGEYRWANRDEAPRTPPRGPSGGSRPDPAPDPYRVEALQAAARLWAGFSEGDVLGTARVLEAYLRGDQ